MEVIEYRIYSRAIAGGGAVVKSTSSGGSVVKSTSSGGGTTATSSNGGGVAKSTASGGGRSETSSAGGDHRHMMFSGTGFAENSNPAQSVILTAANGQQIMVNSNTSAGVSYYTEGSSGNHTHTVTIPSHTHNFDVPNHTHSVNIPNHTHEIDIPDHTHQIDIPNHTHEIEHGIFKLNRMPTKVTIKVDGNPVPHTALTGDSIDLIPYLALDSDNRVVRGWHTVEITPDDLARINAQLMVQFFMQSRGGVDV